MKVLHVIPAVALRYGGPSVAVRAMTAQLAQRGVAVTVATVDVDRPPTLRGTTERRELLEGVDYRLFRATLPGEWKYSRSLTGWLADQVPSFDIVHVHGLFCHASIPSCRTARRSRVPYIVRPLGMLERWSLRQNGWRKRPYLRLIEGPHLRAAAAIHVTSPTERDDVAALGFGAPVRLLPLGADLPTVNDARGTGTGSVRILFLSRLHPKKGLPLLLQALAKLPSPHAGVASLTVAGGGTDRYEEEMRAVCASLGIQDRVHFVGPVEGAAKEKLLRESDLFVLPSYQENFGIAVAEALAAGLPVVVSDRVGIAEEIRDADAGAVVPCEADALGAALAALIGDPDRRRVMGENGRVLAREKFSWEAAGDRLISLYHELTTARG